MTAHQRVSAATLESLEDALLSNVLPGDLEGLEKEERRQIAEFLADVAAVRKPGELAIKLLSVGGEAGRRRMRLAMVNDDMPFLVDSVAGAIAARGLTIHRLLHPIVRVDRDGKGQLEKAGNGDLVESLIYVELDRADARGRQDLVAEMEQVLSDVRAAVQDWPRMVQAMKEDAASLAAKDDEGSALLTWLADDNFTMLGHLECDADGKCRTGLGVLRDEDRPLWDNDMLAAAAERIERGDTKVIALKADRISPVHRRVPLDVFIVAKGPGRLSVHAGLWTSAAMRADAEDVPVLRRHLEALDRELGFAPSSHGAKALAHAISTLPHDLLISFGPKEVKTIATTAMSLADRPRPTLMMVPGALERHLYTFVWLPREDLTTARRRAIISLLEKTTGSKVTNWAVELGDGELALLRFTSKQQPGGGLPNVAQLDQRIDEMVRGWEPAVEAALAERVGSGRATRLGFTYLRAIPESYRSQIRGSEAAEDIIRLSSISGEERGARLYLGRYDKGGLLHLNTYSRSGLIPLSDAVPVLENFGFLVIDEMPTELDGGIGYIHDFQLALPDEETAKAVVGRAEMIEDAIAAVMARQSENDEFNQLVLFAGLDPRSVVWLRAWFRYLRQTGVSFGLLTVVEALRRAPQATKALVDYFVAAHNPDSAGKRETEMARQAKAFDEALADVRGIDDDRILRLMRSVVFATLRTNAFSPAATEALAFKINSSAVPSLPRPIPYREIWVYSPRVEGVHLRGGPIARGGLRWSDRRDDFRTEILGLMKAQLVKNAVIVPTGAKGGFYPKMLPNPQVDRDAWLAEGTESYRIFIRSLLSVTDNIVNDEVVHPDGVVIHDGDDPYFVVAADKGTASFSDVANAIALERGFWLGDAFASGGSNGYDHKAMGITAKGAWISVQRHFLEMGIDVQVDPIRVVGCGDMSGDVFGNGMLLSQAIKLVAAFDHRHIFIDPNPEPARSWAERKRLFDMPRSSWDDYDRKAMSKGAMIVPRSQKSIQLTPEAMAALGVEECEIEPTTLISAILKAPADLAWFGGIGTYIKASSQTNAEVGDPANDALRVNGAEVGAKVIGEGANLAITQAGRIEFAVNGGRINTDFIDNSAGVDCSDNEVNIKIPLNREMREGELTEERRNILLARMTDEVAELVLEDNRLQSLALSVAEARGAQGLPGFVRTIEMLETTGRLDRKVEGLESSDALLRRANDNRGLTRPELAVVLSMSKLSLQAAAEELQLGDDKSMEGELFAAFPEPMRKNHADSIRNHRLRHQIVATKVANRLVNRLGPSVALDMTEEEGVRLPHVVTAFLVAERLLDLQTLWRRIECSPVNEQQRIQLFAIAAKWIRSHLADILRGAGGESNVSTLTDMLGSGLDKVAAKARTLLRPEVREEAEARRALLVDMGATDDVVDTLIRLFELDGVFGLAALSSRRSQDVLALTRAYTRIGEVLGIDWAQQQISTFTPSDQWERLLVAGLARDFEQLRLDFLSRTRGDDSEESVERWVKSNPKRIAQFRSLVERARSSGSVSLPMLSQIASQARVLLAR